MPIPGDIGFHSIESGFFYLPEAVTPQFLRATEVMERSTEYKNILVPPQRNVLSFLTEWIESNFDNSYSLLFSFIDTM